MNETLERIKVKNSHEPEFMQAVSEIYESVRPVLEEKPEWVAARIFERMFEPDRIIKFRVEWIDDADHIRINKGYRVQMNNATGPYKGGLRFHTKVNESVMKFLAAEQTIKNALTGLPMGGAKGGSDFNPKGKSKGEMMRFCQAFMRELSKYIGSDTDVPAGDIGVGTREIGYMFGAYRQIKNDNAGFITGKGLQWGGSHIRAEATGYGLVYFVEEMLREQEKSLIQECRNSKTLKASMNNKENKFLNGKRCLVSGSGNVAQYTTEKLIEYGAKVLTMSDSDGSIYDKNGIDREKLAFIMELKNARRGRIKEYAKEFPNVSYVPVESDNVVSGVWKLRADCAFPCATENEINAEDAVDLIENGVKLVAEGANMPCTPEAIKAFLKAGILYGSGKAANAGGVAVSGLEMSQNSMRYVWSRYDVNEELLDIMRHIHSECLSAAEAYGQPGNYEAGANIAGFIKVATAMFEQGIV